MAEKINTKPLSGFQEFTPQLQISFNKIKRIIENEFEKNGFLEIDTPTIERWEVLNNKGGEENQKLIYKIAKDTEQGLRFDLTVPFARYVANNLNNLPMPFQKYQIGKVYRGERAQAGRFREFYQCDIDIVSRKESWFEELIIINLLQKTLNTILTEKQLLTQELNFKIHIGHREIWNIFFQQNNLEEKSNKILQIVDMSKKVSRDTLIKAFQDIDLTTNNIKNILEIIDCKNPNDFYTILVDSEKLNDLIMNIYYNILSIKNTIFDMSITRGLDYYTGIVFETFITSNGMERYGSICSGGRYDNLIDSFLPNSGIKGIGGSIGLTRLFDILKTENLLKTIPIYNLVIISNTKFSISNIERFITFFDLKQGLEFAKKFEIPFIIISETDEFKVKNTKEFTTKSFKTMDEALKEVQTELAKL